MKKIIYLLFFVFCVAVAQSQPITARGTSSVTVSDARLQAQLNLFIPRYADTTAANLQKGIDSCGAIIFTYNGNKLWKRSCSPKRWEDISGGESVVPSLQQVTDVGSTTTNTITAYNFINGGFLNSNINNTYYGYSTLSDGGTYYPIYDTSEGYSFYIKTLKGLPFVSPSIHWTARDLEEVDISVDSLLFRQPYDRAKESISLQSQSTASSQFHRLFYPSTEYTTQPVDTLATLADIRNGGSGGTAYWSKTGNGIYPSTLSDSVGIGVSSPAYKLDVNGIANAYLGLNLSSSGSKIGLYPSGNAIQIWAGSNKLSTYSLIGNAAGSYYIQDVSFQNSASSSGTQNAFRISSSVLPSGANSMIHNQIMIDPEYAQASYGTGAVRGIYYNPTITSLNTSPHYAWESTSGGIKFGGMSSSTDTATYKPLGIDASGNLSKVSSWNLNGLYVPYVGATQDLDMGLHQVNAQSFYANGSNGNGHIHLKHQSADATGQGQTTTIFADANGDFKWKNAGNYYTTLKTSGNTADRVYTFPNATTTLIGASDTSSMLSPYLRKVDTASLSNRINLKLNISDTATMLSKYLRKTDTATLSNRINLKVNISDTASMLSNYVKKDTSAFYLINDATTTNTTATNTNLTFSVGANETYRIMVAGTASKATTTTGMKIAIGAPTGATLKGVFQGGGAAASTALTNQILSAPNTLLASAFATGAGVEVPFRFEGVITTSSTTGSITLQFATVTSNTATIYAGTVMQLIKVKGL